MGNLALRGQHDGGTYSFVNSEATAVVGRMTTPPSNARKKVIDQLWTDIKLAVSTAKLGNFYVLAAHNTQAALLDWLGVASDAVPNNSPTFAADQGYKGDNITKSLSATAHSPWAQNSATMFVYTLDQAAANDGALMNGTDGHNIIQCRATGPVINQKNNETTLHSPACVVSDIGFWSSARSSSTVTTLRKDSVIVQALSSGAVSTGSVATFTFAAGTQRVAVIGWGQFMLQAEINALETAFRTYLTALGN